MDQQHQRQAEFVEIDGESDSDNQCERRVYMEAYVATNVEPKQCGPLVQRLSAEGKVLRQQQQQQQHQQHDTIHYVDITHLKRVKRVLQNDNEDMIDNNKLTNGGVAAPLNKAAVPSADSTKQGTPAKETNDCGKSGSVTPMHPKKRKRATENNKIRLEVLIGAASQVHRMFASEHKTNDDDDIPIDDVITTWLESKYQVQNVCKVTLPGRTPSSENEWKDYEKIWPTTFFPNKSIERKQADRQLSSQEVEQMRKGMQAALLDAQQQQQQQDEHLSLAALIVGTVILDPSSGNIVGRAAPERAIQRQPGVAATTTATIDRQNHKNPLATSILYAIQSVSRAERECAVKQGMDSDVFQGGQYLCTGHDVYTTVEPSIFEAMALVHSRVRRVVVGCSRTTGTSTTMSGRGALTDVKVHALPGTNHKYRAFLCHPKGDLARQCRELLTDKNKETK